MNYQSLEDTLAGWMIQKSHIAVTQIELVYLPPDRDLYTIVIRQYS